MLGQRVGNLYILVFSISLFADGNGRAVCFDDAAVIACQRNKQLNGHIGFAICHHRCTGKREGCAHANQIGIACHNLIGIFTDGQIGMHDAVIHQNRAFIVGNLEAKLLCGFSQRN